MNIFGYEISIGKKKPNNKTKTGGGIPKTKNVIPPPGRVSSPNNGTGKVFDENIFTELRENLKIVKPLKILSYIPIIRKLYKVNADVGSVLYDAIQLTNTGHDIYFDDDVPFREQAKMRKHLERVTKNWGYGVAGINGLINKLIAQIYIGGALSAEWVVDLNLEGIDSCAMVNPEEIVFALESGYKYIPYQKNNVFYGLKKEYIKLNPVTYKYTGLYSDEDTPYGVPPFVTAIESLKTQKDMKQNINHILNQLGLLGYLEVNIEKPDMKANEPESAYISRLNSLLDESKRNILYGFKEGVVVGFQDEHSFEFHATGKNLTGVSELFNLNENQLANGLKTSAAFLGVQNQATDSFGTVVFTKMLSQLKNVQQILAGFLEQGYKLELTLAGYNVDNITVMFKPSTITDDLKIQQGLEIKQRNLRNMWVDGIIDQTDYALEMGYDKPKKKVDPTIHIQKKEDTAKTDPVKKADREADKDKSDRKVRDKNNPQPKRKDQSTKER